MANDALSVEHRRSLEVDSSILSSMIDEARIRTATTREELRQIGFPGALPPALVFPVLTWSSGTEPVHHRIRPDKPKVDRSGNEIKYVQPRAVPCRLYCPPTARRLIEGLQSPADRPEAVLPYVFVTEGEKKVLSLLSRDLAAIGLAGVWNWRQRAVLRGDFDVIGLRGVPVCLVFDSDAATNHQVAKAEDALASMLRAIGAQVCVCRLPAGPEGKKVGVDDFFAQGGSVDDLSTLIGLHEPTAHLHEEPYREHEGRIERFVPPSSREESGRYVPVTMNYTARVVNEKVWDDGIDQTLYFSVEGELANGRSLPLIDVPAAQFQSWSWVQPRWGIQPRLTVGMNAEKHACAATQYLSGEVPRRQVFGHTGWRLVEGKYVYLHADGAIGEEGSDDTIETDLPSFLAGYKLPDPPEGAELKAAVRASAQLLETAPHRVSSPLWASVWRSVLGEAAFSILLVGPTGARKSSLVSVFLAHFGGSLARKESLALQWSSTANALEGATFYAKDACLGIDDFVPSRGTASERQAMNKLASRVLRSAGNLAGRSRMGRDGRLQAVKPPRALVVSTGEELPEGASELRRSVVIELGPDEVELEGLTIGQTAGEGGLFAQCLAAFLKWAAPQLDELRARVSEASRDGRDGTRASEVAAELSEAVRIWAEFAVTAGLTAAEVTSALDTTLEGIRHVIAVQASVSIDQDPVGRFLEILGEGLAAGMFYLRGRVAGTRVDCDGSESKDLDGTQVGWIDDDQVYLLPAAAYAAVSRLADAAGRPVNQRDRALWKRMDERGLLKHQGEKGRNTCRLSFPGAPNVHVVVIPKALLTLDFGSIGSNGIDGPIETAMNPGPSFTLPIGSPESVLESTESGVKNGSGRNGALQAPAGHHGRTPGTPDTPGVTDERCRDVEAKERDLAPPAGPSDTRSLFEGMVDQEVAI